VSHSSIGWNRSGSGGIARQIAAALFCSLPLLAAADGQDDSIASLKAAVLDLIQARPVAPEATGSLAIYIGDRAPGVLLDEIKVWIDDAPPLRYEYSDREAYALHQGGLHRLAISTLSPGAHRFRADFAMRLTDAPPDHLRLAGVLEQKINIGAQPEIVELELDAGGFMSKPNLQFHSLSAGGAEAFAPGSGGDPRVRFAEFLTDTDRPFAAATGLLQLQAQLGGGSLSDEFYTQLARALDQFGLPQRAQALGRDKADAGGDAMAQAYADYNRGVALMKDGNTAGGTALLTALVAGKSQDAESAALRDRANLVLGYAQLRNRTGSNAIALFSNVRSTGPYTNAALLGLGWALLAPSGNGENASARANAGSAAAASAPFQRIPVLLQPHLTDDIAKVKLHEPYSLKLASSQEEHALRQALVPWMELIGRDPLDPAVQEGMIAIPYALNHVGASEEANERYLRAVKLLGAVDAQLDVAKQRVNGGQMIQALDTREAANNGWPWWLAAYPREHWWLADDPKDPLGAPETFYLQHLMADDVFRAALQDFHDLRLMSDTLQGMSGDAAAAGLQSQVAAATAAQAQLLQKLAIAELEREQRRTRLYLGEARFALAHMNEPPPPPTVPAVAAR